MILQLAQDDSAEVQGWRHPAPPEPPSPYCSATPLAHPRLPRIQTTHLSLPRGRWCQALARGTSAGGGAGTRAWELPAGQGGAAEGTEPPALDRLGSARARRVSAASAGRPTLPAGLAPASWCLTLSFGPGKDAVQPPGEFPTGSRDGSRQRKGVGVRGSVRQTGERLRKVCN